MSPRPWVHGKPLWGRTATRKKRVTSSPEPPQEPPQRSRRRSRLLRGRRLRLGLRLRLLRLRRLHCLHGRSGAIGILHDDLVADLEVAQLDLLAGLQVHVALLALHREGAGRRVERLDRAGDLLSLRLGRLLLRRLVRRRGRLLRCRGRLLRRCRGRRRRRRLLRRDREARDREHKRNCHHYRENLLHFVSPPKGVFGCLARDHSRTVPTVPTDTTH